MGYAVHIRRKAGAISLDQWLSAARGTPDLREEAPLDSGPPRFVWGEAIFVWRGGEVHVDDLDDEWCAKLGEVADRLGAEAIGDDGERYLADGRVDYGDGAQTLHRVSTMAALKNITVHSSDPSALKPRSRALWIVLALATLVALALAFKLAR